MGTILASAIIATASGILHDASNVRWTASKMLGYLNDGIRDTVLANPTSNVVNGNIDLVAGTKQTLPAGTVLLIDIRRNMGTDGATPGRAPRFMDQKEIDAENPNWHTDTTSATVKHWIYDERDKNVYYVYPPQPSSGQGKLEAVRSTIPAAIASGDAIPIGDEYANALVDYLLHRAYAQDPVNIDLSLKYLESFLLRVTGKKKMDDEVEAARDREK